MKVSTYLVVPNEKFSVVTTNLRALIFKPFFLQFFYQFYARIRRQKTVYPNWNVISKVAS